MKINYLTEAYFKDVTIKQEDSRTNIEKTIQLSRKVIGDKIINFILQWFSNLPVKYIQGGNIFLFDQPSSQGNWGFLEKEMKNYDYTKSINKIDFNNKKVYINFYIVGSINFPVPSVMNKKSTSAIPSIVLCQDDTDVIKAMMKFEIDFKKAFAEFDIEYNPCVREFLVGENLRPLIKLTLGDIEYSYLKYFFEKVKSLELIQLSASIYDDKLSQFVKDFSNDYRLNHKLDSIVLLRNRQITDDSYLKLVFALIKDTRSFETFKRIMNDSIRRSTNELNMLYDEDKLSRDDKLRITELENRIPIFKKLEKIDYSKLIK